MGEKESDLLGKLRTSRRHFLTRTAPAIGIISYEAVSNLRNPPQENPLIFEQINTKVAEKLLEFSPITIFHNIMNNGDRFAWALRTPTDFVDVDVSKYLDNLFASHNPYEEVPFLERMARKFLPIGPSQPKLKDVMATLRDHDQPVCLDLKNLGSKDIPRIQRILAENDLTESTTFSSNNWKLLQEIGDVYGPDKIYFSIGTQADLERFTEGEIPEGNISLAQHLATPETVKYLKSRGYKVILFTINSAADALKYLRMGIDGFVSDNVGLLDVFGNRPQELLQSLTE